MAGQRKSRLRSSDLSETAGVSETSASFRWGELTEKPASCSIALGRRFYASFELNGVVYQRGECALIANDDTDNPDDVSQLYVARLEELCDLGEDTKLSYRYQGSVRWYTRPAEARIVGVKLPNDVIHDSEVFLTHPKATSRWIDLETIRGKCSVIHVAADVDTVCFADITDQHGNPQLYCRFQMQGRMKIKPVLSATSTPVKSSKTGPSTPRTARDARSTLKNGQPDRGSKGSSSTGSYDTNNNNADNGSLHDGLATRKSGQKKEVVNNIRQQYRELIQKDLLVDMSPKKRVSPLKLVRTGRSKENQYVYTPEKRLTTNTPSQGTVEKLTNKLKDLECRTPRSALKDIRGNMLTQSTTTTPTSAGNSKAEATATTRSGRKVRRAMFFDEEEKGDNAARAYRSQEIRDEDLVSEDSDATIPDESTDEITSTSEDNDSGDDDVVVKSQTRKRTATKTGPKHATAPRKSSSTRNKKSSPKSLKSRSAISSRTPSMPARRVLHKGPNNDIERALDRLHVCAVPDQLSCRESQFAEIYEFVESRLADGVGGCMYISGVPGTGKTATVREVMTALNDARDTDEVPHFKYIEINGMKLTEPHQAYVQILKQLTGKKATPEHAAEMLTDIFKGKKAKKGKADAADDAQMVVLLADELDLLWTRKQQVLYNLFDWPTHPSSRLVVVAIANTMDLPERMVMNKVASRMGLCRMTFQPYTFQELQEIVRARLLGLELMDPDAVQFVSRKVAALSGDARRALDVCRRAVELSAQAGPQKASSGKRDLPTSSPRKKAKTYPVTMAHVNQAIQEMFSSAKVVAIGALSLHEQLLLRSIVAEFQRTGVEEAVFHRVQSQYESLARLEGVAPLHSTLLSTLLARMASFRLLMIGDARQDFHQKICMNATADDVNFALRQRSNNERSDDDGT